MQLGSDVRPQNGLLAEMTLLAEKPRQGVPTSTNALHRGFGFVISSTSLGIVGSLYDEGVRSRSTGKERDSESGNDYMFARYYNSATGRFLSPDWDAKSDDPVPYAKLDNPQSLNLYAYVLNNPVGNLDPNGHETPWGSPEGSLRVANIVAGAAKGAWNLVANTWNTAANLLNAQGEASGQPYIVSPNLPTATYDNKTQAISGGVATLGLIAADAFGGAKGSAAEEPGVVYKRTNPATGEDYVGQSKSPARYDARQGEHNAAQGVRHDYQILDRGRPGTDLDVKEETQIRRLGGPKTQGGPLANRRYQMSEKKYRSAGGTADKPTQ